VDQAAEHVPSFDRPGSPRNQRCPVAGRHGIGEPATALFVVVDGQLKEGLVTADGDEYIGEIFSAGGVAGEPGLFAVERDRVVDLVAMTPVVALAIQRDWLIAFLLRRPATMLRMLEGLATQARSAVEEAARLERVCTRIVRSTPRSRSRGLRSPGENLRSMLNEEPDYSGLARATGPEAGQALGVSRSRLEPTAV
jgi:CRP-like cAMP-binding protein